MKDVVVNGLFLLHSAFIIYVINCMALGEEVIFMIFDLSEGESQIISCLLIILLTPAVLVLILDSHIKKIINPKFRNDIRVTGLSFLDLVILISKKKIVLFVILQLIYIYFCYFLYRYMIREMGPIHDFWDQVLFTSIFYNFLFVGILISFASPMHRITNFLKGNRFFYKYTTVYVIVSILTPIFYFFLAFFYQYLLYEIMDVFAGRVGRALFFFLDQVSHSVFSILITSFFLFSVIRNSRFISKNYMAADD